MMNGCGQRPKHTHVSALNHCSSSTSVISGFSRDDDIMTSVSPARMAAVATTTRLVMAVLCTSFKNATFDRNWTDPNGARSDEGAYAYEIKMPIDPSTSSDAPTRHRNFLRSGWPRCAKLRMLFARLTHTLPTALIALPTSHHGTISSRSFLSCAPTATTTRTARLDRALVTRPGLDARRNKSSRAVIFHFLPR